MKIEERAIDLYDYWLSTHGKISPRGEPKLDNWVLEIIFCGMDRESGRIKGQKLDFFYHGTVIKFRERIKQNGLRSAEGAACFTRKITHALESFALMGNYTMVGGGTVDAEIEKLVKQGVIDSQLTKEEKAKVAFRYWCRDEIRKKLGLLMVWRPPENMVALDVLENKIHKRHFALYSPETNQTATERRKELAGKRGEKVYLDPKFLLAELKPTLELRLAVVRLEQSLARGENIITQDKSLTEIVKKALLNLGKSYTHQQLAKDILTSIVEGYVLNLVHTIVLSLSERKNPQRKITHLKNLPMPIDYLDKYRESALKKLVKKLS